VKYKTKWHSLSDFKTFLEKETKEEIISYNGYELITKKASYGLAFGELIVSEKKKRK
jgi:predicted nucleotidyltransferase